MTATTQIASDGDAGRGCGSARITSAPLVELASAGNGAGPFGGWKPKNGAGRPRGRWTPPDGLTPASDEEIVLALRRACGAGWGAVKAWAANNGCPYETVRSVRARKSRPTAKIAAVLGLEVRRKYVTKSSAPRADTGASA